MANERPARRLSRVVVRSDLAAEKGRATSTPKLELTADDADGFNSFDSWREDDANDNTTTIIWMPVP